MARTRNIKPGFFKSEQLADCDPLARILFAGLWTQADREGILEDRPRRIKSECLPYDDCDVDELLEQLSCRGFIVRYGVDGAKYISIPTFGSHQNPHRDEKPRGFPAAPCNNGANTVQAQLQHSLNLPPETVTNHLPPETATAAAQPAGACADEKAGTKNGKRPSVFDEVTVAILRSPSKLDAWWRKASNQRPRPVISLCEADRLRVHAAAERVLRTKCGSACAVFASIIAGKKWDRLTGEFDDFAQARIKELDAAARGELTQ